MRQALVILNSFINFHMTAIEMKSKTATKLPRTLLFFPSFSFPTSCYCLFVTLILILVSFSIPSVTTTYCLLHFFPYSSCILFLAFPSFPFLHLFPTFSPTTSLSILSIIAIYYFFLPYSSSFCFLLFTSLLFFFIYI